MAASDVLAALQRSDAMLVAACQRLYARNGDSPGEYRGLFISDQEFLELLERPFGEAALSPVRGRPGRARDDPLVTDSWQHLVDAFGLTPFEQDALLLSLLPELDLKYDRIYAYLQDDVTAKRPSVDLLLNLLCLTLPDRLQARTAFEPDATLVRYGLLQLAAPAEGPDALLRRTVSVAPDVVHYLLHSHVSDPASLPYWATPEGCYDPTLYPSELRELVERLIVSEQMPFWVHVHAPDGWPAEALAHDLAAQRRVPLLRLAVGALLAEGAPLHTQVRDAVRQARLTGAVLLVALPREPAGPDEPRLPGEWDTLLRGSGVSAVFFVPNQSVAPPLPEGLPLFTLALPRPGFEARRLLWERALAGIVLADDAELAELAGRYRLDGSQIWTAAQSARALARQRDPLQEAVSYADLAASARAVSSVRLGNLAQQITPRNRWEDLVLPADRLAQIREMCDQFRYRHIVYDAWGLGARSSRGQGLSALFAGPSGTGKTMAAEVIANDLGLDLFKIDLSGVVSKYIGETEKNLDRIFDLARDSNAILLFDEADALFGKRSETKDAHDRYANIEISYLLQKVEEYDGVVILTSNLRQNLDEAFMRRLQFSIEFPFPEREARLLIWQRSAPPAMPVAADVDWELLADRFRLSGGSIRNALVTAAFLAARDGAAIGMQHLLWGIRREYQKLGKLVDEDEFALLGAGAAERVSRRHGR